MDPSIAAPMVAGAPEGWRTTLDKLEKMVVRMHGGTETGVRSVAHAPPLGALVPAFYDPDSRSPGL